MSFNKDTESLAKIKLSTSAREGNLEKNLFKFAFAEFVSVIAVFTTPFATAKLSTL
jgi:hypothetical protein